MNKLRSILCAGFLAGFALAAPAKNLTTRSLEAWLQKYDVAWETLDAAAAGRIFTADATYQDMPFKTPMHGRAAIEEYWRQETGRQSDVKFESKVIAMNGNTGVAHWSATFKLKHNGVIIALDGMFLLEFDASGQCKSLREWWHVKPD